MVQYGARVVVTEHGTVRYPRIDKLQKVPFHVLKLQQGIVLQIITLNKPPAERGAARYPRSSYGTRPSAMPV